MAGGRSSATGRRLFAALELPEDVRDHVVDAVRRARAATPPPGGSRTDLVRWSDPSSWHLTLAFYGAVDPAVDEALVAQVAAVAARHAPVALRVVGAGRFGQRVLWAGVEGGPALVVLAGSLAAGALASGIAVEDRPYRPHLTLARGLPGADLRAAVAALAGGAGPSWVADRVVLVHSVLGGGADGTARHERVGAWALTGSPL